MIVILFSWLILFYFVITFGVATEYLLKIKAENTIITVILGMITETFLLTCAAFFTSIGLELFLFNLFLTTFLALCFRKKIASNLSTVFNEFNNLATYLKVVFAIILLSSLLKCAQLPYILDNESYYIQTIKWLNQYGFVKGLANLNIAFGQTSAWHILQAGFNFSFITNSINDINGFILVVSSFYFITKFDSYFKQKKQPHWIGFILLFNALSFQFINSPSPDLPVFIIAQIVFYLFLKENKTLDTVKTISLLLIFMFFIKITMAPIALLLLFLFYKEKKGIVFFSIVSFLFSILWIAKNLILTGYPFYPLSYFPIDCDWIIPEKLLNFFNNYIHNHEFLDISNYRNLTLFEKFFIWIQFEGINRIFNIGILILFTLTAFTTTVKTKVEYQFLYLVLLIHFIIIFIISPQFRFFLAEFIFLSCLLIADFLNRHKYSFKWIQIGLFSAAILPIFLLYFINLKVLTDNKLNQNSDSIRWSQIYLPEKNTRFNKMIYDTIHKGNLNYFSPRIDFYIYASSDGSLPCVNKKQIECFENYLKIYPQMRTKNLKDGFYSKSIE